ncbi:hypothetical protein VP01_1080g13 [Puccinia sorghi]|uniref:Uncharacterized protein n=1 Tax=Puccinia sorghi TaxID=27349 RepID=A0A0L6VTC9_9BASI|nr:hypothetical protein VP01_1080g13 [Puccinia sorghi]
MEGFPTQFIKGGFSMVLTWYNKFFNCQAHQKWRNEGAEFSKNNKGHSKLHITLFLNYSSIATRYHTFFLLTQHLETKKNGFSHYSNLMCSSFNFLFEKKNSFINLGCHKNQFWQNKFWVYLDAVLKKSNFSSSYSSLQKKLAQLPAVDMQNLPGSFCCYSNHSPKVIQPSFDAQSLCRLHSDCAKRYTYANMWSLDGSLAGACCMSNAGKHEYLMLYHLWEKFIQAWSRLVQLDKFLHWYFDKWKSSWKNTDDKSGNIKISFKPLPCGSLVDLDSATDFFCTSMLHLIEDLTFFFASLFGLDIVKTCTANASSCTGGSLMKHDVEIIYIYMCMCILKKSANIIRDQPMYI